MAVLITFQGVNLLDSVFKLNSIHAYAEGGGVFMLAMLGLAMLIPLVMHFLPKPVEEDLRKDEPIGDDFTMASTLDDKPGAAAKKDAATKPDRDGK